MNGKYDRINSRYKNIKKLDIVTLSKLISQIPINSNCLMTGGIELVSNQGGRVYNRKVILLAFIKKIICEYPSGVVVFYKSLYIKDKIKIWANSYKGSRKIVFLDNEADFGLNMFGEMNIEEIIYAIKNIAKQIDVSLNQYSENFLYYLLKILKIGNFGTDFDNILTLVDLTNEDLSIIAKKLNLKDEAKYFAKSNNGGESIRRIIKSLNNFMIGYYRQKNKTNLCHEIKNKSIVFIYISDQYQKEILEYFTEEIKDISKYNPYLIFDDITIKNNESLENLLIGSISIRHCFSTINLEAMVSSNNFDNFNAFASTKLILHYNDVNAAEKIASSFGYYYHLKVSEEHSKSKEAFSFSPFDIKVTDGNSVTEEKRNIIEGTNLASLNGEQLYFIDTTIEKYYIDKILFDR